MHSRLLWLTFVVEMFSPLIWLSSFLLFCRCCVTLFSLVYFRRKKKSLSFIQLHFRWWNWFQIFILFYFALLFENSLIFSFYFKNSVHPPFNTFFYYFSADCFFLPICALFREKKLKKKNCRKFARKWFDTLKNGQKSSQSTRPQNKTAENQKKWQKNCCKYVQKKKASMRSYHVCISM